MSNRYLVESCFSPSDDMACSEAEGGMVAAAHPAATKAGVLMLKKGGNAVDAAVATALALCVCEPQACSLGGQSYGLMHVNGRSLFLDGSGRVPLHLDPEGLTENEILFGYRGTSVPTTPLVLACMQKRFGNLSWDQVVIPAMEIAEDGYEITGLQHCLQIKELESFKAVPGESGAHYFLKDGKVPYGVGDTFVQPDLARLLKRLAEKGVEDFYTGWIAKKIAADIADNAGFLTEEDLRAIPWPHERSVIKQQVFGRTMITSPPPTQGRLLVYMLKVAEKIAGLGMDLLADSSMKLFADLYHKAYRIRIEQSPYPDLYSCDFDHILTGESIEEVTDQVIRSCCKKVEIPTLVGGETTHLAVMDRRGNCVGITQSVNMIYGSKAAAGGLGFLYNNYLVDSLHLPGSHPHALIPGRTPPCSVSPFILMDENDEPWLTAGSPGSQRIVTTLALFLVRILHGSMSIDKAMRYPRFHCQNFREIVLEKGRYSNRTIASLREDGFTVKENPPFHFGAVHAVLKREDSRKLQGVAEVRRDGTAEGVH